MTDEQVELIAKAINKLAFQIEQLTGELKTQELKKSIIGE